MNNVKPVGLFLTPGLFGLATVTSFKKLRVQQRLELFDFVKQTGKPFVKNGREYFFAIREVTVESGDGEGKETRRTKQLMIGARTLAAANEAFEKVGRRWKRRPPPNPPTPVATKNNETTMWRAIRRHMAKGYPKTIAAMHAAEKATTEEQKIKLREEVFLAYVEETAKIAGDGVDLVAPTANKELVKKIARHWESQKRHKRKRPYFDPVDFYLILGCQWKGYGAMTWDAVLADVKTFPGIPLMELDALRQRWKRLGLPSERKRGRKSE